MSYVIEGDHLVGDEVIEWKFGAPVQEQLVTKVYCDTCHEDVDAENAAKHGVRWVDDGIDKTVYRR